MLNSDIILNVINFALSVEKYFCVFRSYLQQINMCLLYS